MRHGRRVHEPPIVPLSPRPRPRARPDTVKTGMRTGRIFIGTSGYNWKVMDFKLVSSYSPRGDQATAIEQLSKGD